MGLRASGYLFGQGQWTQGSILTNPTSNTDLVKTASQTPGSYLIGAMGASSADFVYDVQVVDSGESVVRFSQRRRSAAGNDDWNSGNKVPFQAGDKVRCRLVSSITGEIQISLFIQKVAE